MSRVQSHAGVGASSILLIIVVLLLTTFGVLTLVSARADSRLTARTVETAAAYYEADAAAQRSLLAIDEALSAGMSPMDIDILAATPDAPGVYEFLCETGDGRAIRVRVSCDAATARCAIREYKLVHLDGWDKPEDSLFVLPGN